jgi:hypothetical protein
MGRGWDKRAAVGMALMVTIILAIAAMIRRDRGRARATPKPGRCYHG